MIVVAPLPGRGRGADRRGRRAGGRGVDRAHAARRRWRDLVGVAGGQRAPARRSPASGDPPHELVARLARLSLRRRRGRGAGELRPGRDPGHRARSTPARSAAGSRSGRETLRAEIDARRGQARERGLRRQGARRTSSRRSARSSPATGRSSRSWAAELAWGYGEAEAYLASLEPLGWRFGLERIRRLVSALGMPQHRFALDPRRRHERQVLGGEDDARRCSRRTASARAPTSRPTPSAGRSGSDRRARDRPGRVRRRGRAGRPVGRGRQPRARRRRVGDPVRGGDRGRVRRPGRRRGWSSA